jgi:hypothetical protein
MAFMITYDVPGMSKEQYDEMAVHLLPTLRTTSGFVAHASGPLEVGWQVTEIWDSQEARDQWFDENIRPHIPIEWAIETTIREIHTFMTSVAADR